MCISVHLVAAIAQGRQKHSIPSIWGLQEIEELPRINSILCKRDEYDCAISYNNVLSTQYNNINHLYVEGYSVSCLFQSY